MPLGTRNKLGEKTADMRSHYFFSLRAFYNNKYD